MTIQRSNLVSRFGIVRDVRPVTDPWGIGIVFQLERSDSREHQEYVQKKMAENPVLRKFEVVTSKATIAAMAENLQKDGFDRDLLASKASEFARGVDFTPEELAQLKPDRIESVARRIKGWAGLRDADTGLEVSCDEATKRELLSSTAWVEDGLPYGNQSLGAALCQFLELESEKHAEYRQGVIADSGKGFGPTPAGSMTTSDGSTATPV